MNKVNQLSVRSGVVEDVSHTTHISGGGESSARTTHITMIKVAGQHAEYRADSPLPISEGESVKIVGADERGLFKVYALQNVSTGWMTEVPKGGGAMSGCLIAFSVLWVLIGSTITIGFIVMVPFIAIFPVAVVGLGLWGIIASITKVKKLRALSQEAHMILLRAATQSAAAQATPPQFPSK